MRPNLLLELKDIGYEFSLDDDRLKLTYRKRSEPPEIAEFLIAELRDCKAEAVHILKRASLGISDHNSENGGEVPAESALANSHLDKRKDEEMTSRLNAITDLWINIFDRIALIWPRGFVSTEAILTVEDEIEKVQALVISGKASLEDFRKVALLWEKTVKKELEKLGVESKDQHP